MTEKTFTPSEDIPNLIKSFANQDVDDLLEKSPEDTDHEEAPSRHRSREIQPTAPISRIHSREAPMPKAIVDISVIKITTQQTP